MQIVGVSVLSACCVIGVDLLLHSFAYTISALHNTTPHVLLVALPLSIQVWMLPGLNCARHRSTQLLSPVAHLMARCTATRSAHLSAQSKQHSSVQLGE